jgi:hypothetical protein
MGGPLDHGALGDAAAMKMEIGTTPDLLEDVLGEVLEDRLWAVHVDRPPAAEHAMRGCPTTGWLHEGRLPYRVIVSRDPFRLPEYGERMPYTGVEETIDFDAWLAGY